MMAICGFVDRSGDEGGPVGLAGGDFVLFLNERLQSSNVFVPLKRGAGQEVSGFRDWIRLDSEPCFSSDALRVDNAGLLQNSQVLCHPLTRQLQAVRKFRNRMLLSIAQPGNELQAGDISQRRKYWC